MKKSGLTIRQKITATMAITSIFLIVSILVVSYFVNKKNIVALCESYMYDVCISTSDTLVESFNSDSGRDDLNNRLEYILDNVGIQTMSSSICYLVDKDGQYLYHSDDALVGTTMSSNPTIQAIIDKINNESRITTADIVKTTVDG